MLPPGCDVANILVSHGTNNHDVFICRWTDSLWDHGHQWEPTNNKSSSKCQSTHQAWRGPGWRILRFVCRKWVLGQNRHHRISNQSWCILCECWQQRSMWMAPVNCKSSEIKVASSLNSEAGEPSEPLAQSARKQWKLAVFSNPKPLKDRKGE